MSPEELQDAATIDLYRVAALNYIDSIRSIPTREEIMNHLETVTVAPDW